MKYLFLIVFIFFNTLYSQVDKGNFLIGGNGYLYFIEDDINQNFPEESYTIEKTSIRISPMLGYFIFDKFAVGITPSFNFEDNNYKGYHMPFYGDRTYTYSVGPFIRYYLLPGKLKPILDFRYLYSFERIEYTSTNLERKKFIYVSESTQNEIIPSVGLTYLFNNSFGLELLLSYSIKVQNLEKNQSFNYQTRTESNSLLLNIGFQIYL